ncbi:MAG: hypothetical protein R3E50_11475 [Halioglobus sp.]
MSNVVEQGREEALSGDEEFRLRMENQCRRIKQYRLAMLRERGRLLSPDEAALEWIERYAATFDNTAPGH